MDIQRHNNDDELIASLNRGDQAAFHSIYSTYNRQLFAFARKNISSKEECEEILQEVFTYLWQNHKTVRITSLRAYLYQAVKNRIIEHIRVQKLNREYVRHYLLFESVYDIYAQERPDMEPVALQQWIDSSISELHERCQAAFRLRYGENLSQQEIAARLNINKRTAENYIYTAIGHLRKSFQKLYRATIMVLGWCWM